MKTPEEARRLWIEALRSGEYKQGFKDLHCGNTFCCLGVACDLYQKDVGDLDVMIDGQGRYSYDFMDKILPCKVQDWLRLSSNEGDFISKNNDHCNLMNMNDAKVPFKEIADIIEANQDYL